MGRLLQDKMVYSNNKKGAQGIGTLIIFIALILVAAVAAGVLISTVSNLQGKAETTGSEIQQRIATGFTVIQVGASDTSDGQINASTDEFEIRLQLSPGSDPVKVDDVTLALVSKDGSSSYTYNGTNASDTQFTANAVRGTVEDEYINADDVVNLEFVSSANITESEDFEITLFPGAGSAQRIALVTPPSMTTVYTVLK